MSGTTQPGRSEDLWAQVAMTRAGRPHTGAAFSLRQSWSSKGGVNAGAERGHGGISLNPLRCCGRPRAELNGACSLKPYCGKTRRADFRGAAGNVI